MSSTDRLYRRLARATGESPARLRRMGFSLVARLPRVNPRRVTLRPAAATPAGPTG